MRPARKGPENRLQHRPPHHRGNRFNEAGPQGAGKPAKVQFMALEREQASMRPARKGPENRNLEGIVGARILGLQ